jgi:AraC-like DNA-binding protein
MGRITPLTKFPLVTTNNLEEAEVNLSQALTNLQIVRVANPHQFNLYMNKVNIGRTSLVFNRFGAETKIKAGLLGDPVLFVIGNSVPFKLTLDGVPIVVSPRKAAIITPARQMQIERPKSSEAFVLRTSLQDLLHHFEALTASHHQDAFIFDHSIDLTSGSGAMLKRMMNYVAYELEHSPLVMKKSGLLKSFDEMLLTALLDLPHNKRGKLYEDRCYQIAPRVVRQAEEYMRAHLQETITIADLLRICGCSRSVLFSAFKNACGYTPMEFLTEQRLQSVREKLRKPHPEASVTSTALDYGFIHPGRFSQIYRKRFGEYPSDTLQKGK